jgi:RNA polymerase sigma-70 factor, ECF subfamily
MGSAGAAQTSCVTAAAAGHAQPAEEPLPRDFRGLFEAQGAYVWSTLRRLGVAEPDLEDVCHEVFLAIHRHWPEYDPGRPLRPWLFCFAYRKAKDYRRLSYRRHEEPSDGIDRDSSGGAQPDEILEREQERQLVIRALQTLDLDKRAVLILHEIDGCPIPEAASALSIPVNTAYSRLRLARNQFAKAVRQLARCKDEHHGPAEP